MRRTFVIRVSSGMGLPLAALVHPASSNRPLQPVSCGMGAKTR
jgi:hypothetical protein